MGTQFNIDPDQLGVVGMKAAVYIADPDNFAQLNADVMNRALSVQVQKTLGATSKLVMEFPAQDFSELVTNSSALLNQASPNSLTALITPMSMITVVMNRGKQEYPVFMGIVTRVRESFTRGRERVERTIIIEAEDFMYYLTNFAYFTLSWLGSVGGLLQALGSYAGVAQIQALGGFGATPPVVAESFYQNVAGQYLANVNLPTQEGFKSFMNFVDPHFGSFSTTAETDSSLLFPLVPSFYQADGTWWEKFQTFFPAQQYEMFFQTILAASDVEVTPVSIPAPTPTPVASGTLQPISFTAQTLQVSPPQPDMFNTGIPSSTASGSASLTTTVSGKFSTYAVSNCFVARQMPFPYLRVNTDEAVAMTQNQTNKALIEADSLTYVSDSWDALGEYVFTTTNPIVQADIEFSAADSRSFYIVNPRQITSLLGADGANAINSLLVLSIGTLIDPVALAKYGYKPDMMVTDWLSASQDNSPTANTTEDMAQLCLSSLLTFSSIYVPAPLMASGNIVIPLSPWVLPGNKITCLPFKNSAEPWTFYIDGVTHSYSFGGNSVTTLSVSRGLPVSVYSDEDLMTHMLCGLAERVNNDYIVCHADSYPILSTINGLSVVSLANAAYLTKTILPALAVAQGS